LLTLFAGNGAALGVTRLFVLDSSEPSFIRLCVKGVLSPRDYDAFEPCFARELSGRPVPVSLLLDLRGFRGWSLAGFLRDLRFDIRHRRTFSKIAVVGDRRWHEWSTYAAVPIFKAKLRFYSPKDEHLAIAWLRQRRAD
jgi:hypothetical protein